MRVILTGETSTGEAIVVTDCHADSVEPVSTAFGVSFAEVFVSDQRIPLPSSGDQPKASATTLFPPPGGFRFWLLTIPAHCAPMAPSPGTTAELDAIARIDPDYAARLLGDGSGMARADTVEWVIVLSGRVVHYLPDGRPLH
ncbi:hypothetical protein [Paraburkholderia sp. GAS32]|uniref:hypothetical protein n=1 Tax=Paraburkholderia sp. GAS32 TaxID=3035129 RepID=UPI003D1F3A03